MKFIYLKQLINRMPKFVFPLAATLLYILIFISFQEMIGGGLAAFSMFPVILAGWFLGINAALFWSLIVLILNIILYSTFIGVENTGTYLLEAFPAFLSIFAAGVVAGWIRSLDQKNKLELAERKKVELALQISENKFRTQFENMVEGMAIDQIIYEDGEPIDWIITDVNPAFERIMELSREDVIGKLATTIYGSYATIEPFLKVFDTVLKTGTAISNQQHHLIRERKITFSASSLGDNHIAVIFNDVTEQDKALQSEQKQRDFAITMGKITSALNKTMKFDEVLDIILENMGQFVTFQAADITLIQDGKLRMARHIGYAKFGLENFAENFHVTLDAISTAKWMYQNQIPLIISDTSSADLWTTFPEVAWIKSYMGLPIIAKGNMVGILNFHSAQKGYYEGFPYKQLMPFAEQVAIAIDNARTFEDAQKRSHRLALINQVAFQLSQPSDLETIQQLAVDCMASALNLEQVGLALLNQDKDSLTIVSDHPAPDNSSSKGSIITLENNPSMDYIFKHKTSFLSKDAQHDPMLEAVKHFMVGQRIYSILIIPLIIGGDVIGTIGCDVTSEKRILTQDEINLAEILANLVAGQIEQARLLSMEKKRTAELAMLHETSLAITQPYDLSQLHQQIIEKAVWLLDSSAGMLYLETKDKDILECKVSFNNQYDPVGTKLRMGEGAAGIVAQTHQPLIISNYGTWAQKPNTFRNVVDDFPLLSVPVFWQSEIKGVIQIAREPGKQTFDKNDADLLSLFSSQVAITLENSRLYQEVQELAILDPLTGVYNRRGFTEIAEREIERAQRFQNPLALLFLDLDKFKDVNDTHGHGVGDQILTDIANRCKSTLRNVDVICRQGGEEFVILLVESNLKTAVKIAKRIQSVIKVYPFQTEAGSISLTVSIGVAEYQSDMTGIDNLIHHADLAMYKAKSSGRDCVVPFLIDDDSKNT
ncbi:MAG: diguanylate cyclase [Anaerolineaceae bacterium]|nr:diguanylate cyclase [Anaerolineaceae bacterium]